MILCNSRLMQVIIWVKGQVEGANGMSFSYITDERDGCYLLILKICILFVSYSQNDRFLENVQSVKS